MGYNKAREEKKWRLWREAEEKVLRRLCVSEDVIKYLHEADWEDFKAERRFFEHIADTGTYINCQAADEVPLSIRTVQDLLDDIDSEKMYRLLLSVDKLTLQIAVLMMDGHSMRKISKQLNLADKAVYRRVDRLKEKINKIL